MSITLKTLLSICICFNAISVQALTQETVPIVFVGSQTAGTNASMLFISLGTNNPYNCPYVGVYFTDEALRKDALVIALTAKAIKIPAPRGGVFRTALADDLNVVVGIPVLAL